MSNTRRAVFIDLTKKMPTSPTIRRLLAENFDIVGHYAMVSDDETVTVRVPIIKTPSGSCILGHTLSPESFRAFVMQHPKFKEMVEESPEQSRLLGTISEMDFDKGFSFKTILPVIGPLLNGGGGTMKVMNFSLQPASITFEVNDENQANAITTSDKNEEISLSVNLINKSLLTSPKVMKAIAKAIPGADVLSSFAGGTDKFNH